MSDQTVSTKISPYRLAKLTNKIPQMVYNYIRQGLIRAKKNELGHWEIEPDEANKWIEKWAS